MTITPDEKIWTVVKAIADGHELTPSNGNILLNPNSLSKIVSDVELGQLLAKLEQDENLIEIKGHPEDINLGVGADCYSIVINDQEKFRGFLNKAHSQHSGDISKLAADNFLSVCDVAMDICAALQIKSEEEVYIPLMPDVIRFYALFPGDGINMRDRYCDFRWKALGYLKDRGHILDFNIVRGNHRWHQKVNVVVDRYDFDKFYKKLIDAYETRVVEPEKKRQPKSAKEEKVPVSSASPMPSAKLEELPATLAVLIRDRQIRVNDFLLSKPHAVGGNKGFFEYVHENAGVALNRDQMPDYVRVDVGGKSFSKVLNELGFKGEILKAFCPERGKSQLLFRKEVGTQQLETEGINLELLLQELRLAHTRNSPK